MQTHQNRRNAFTLLELLVVIVIMAVLAAALISNYSKARESGWAARCKANLRSLYQASLNFENDHGQDIPYAGPFEVRDINGTYWERQGWVNWTGPGVWPNGTPQASKMQEPIWYGAVGTITITNGTIWEYTNHQLGSYLCPKFAKLSVCGRNDAVRSYVMNGFFYCVTSHTNRPHWYARNIQNDLDNMEPSRLVMFAEMQPLSVQYPIGSKPTICTTCASGYGPVSGTGQNSSSDGNSGVLEAANGATTSVKPYESIGCVHNMSGICRGHVVFLDGHVEAVGPIFSGSTYVSNLTYAACNGLY